MKHETVIQSLAELFKEREAIKNAKDQADNEYTAAAAALEASELALEEITVRVEQALAELKDAPQEEASTKRRRELRPSGISRHDEVLTTLAQIGPCNPMSLARATLFTGEVYSPSQYSAVHSTLKKLAEDFKVSKLSNGDWEVTDKGREEADEINEIVNKKRANAALTT